MSADRGVDRLSILEKLERGEISIISWNKLAFYWRLVI